MKKTILYLIFFNLCLISCKNKTLKSDKKNDLKLKLDKLLSQENNLDQFHGTIVIGNKEKVLYQNAIGIANRVWDIPMKPNYIFDIASLNKSFIAALVMIAVEENRLLLNNKLIELLDSFQYSGKFNQGITIHHLLTHTSGLPDYNAIDESLSNNNFIKFKRSHFSNEAYVDFISLLKAKGEPGKQFYYSNFAYHLLAIILEDIYQLSFSEILNLKICKPIGLKNTFSMKSNQEVRNKMVEGYNYIDKDKVWKRNNFIDLTLGRRIFSTSYDLYKWGSAMTNNSLLKNDLRKIMLQNHVNEINPDVSYGYGWVIFDGKKKYKMGDLSIKKNYIIHGGATEGFKAMLVVIENGEYIISLLSNSGNKTNEMLLTKKIIEVICY